MFLTGPGVVREALGEEIDATGLGGPNVHERNGVCHLVERDEASAAARVRELLSYLPSAAGQTPPRAPSLDPALPDPGAFVPDAPRSVYDVRDALNAVIDRDSLQELCPRWARNVVTAFARIEGRPVGDRRQPAALPRWRARRGGLREGGAVRRASATRSGCR